MKAAVEKLIDINVLSPCICMLVMTIPKSPSRGTHNQDARCETGEWRNALQVTEIGKSTIHAADELETTPMGIASDQVEAIEVFFSYSHKDEKMREKLEKHLSTLRGRTSLRAGMIAKSWRARNGRDKSIRT